MNLLDLFENKTSALTEGVRVVDQDYDLDQIILTMDINGRPVSFTYTDYDEDFDNAERRDVHDQLQRNDWYAALSHPDRMEILDAAYRAIRGLEPKSYQPSVGLEPMDVGDRLDEKGVSEAMKPSDIPPSMRDRLTMRDIEAERPQGAYRFRVTFPDGSHRDFMDFKAARSAADTEKGRMSRLSEDKKIASTGRTERVLKQLRAQYPEAANDMEALLLAFRSGQLQDRRDINRLDTELDSEEAAIDRLEAEIERIKKRRMASEGLRDGEYHVAMVTLDDGSVKRVPVTQDEGFRERIQQHFAQQGRKVQDIKMDYAVQTEAAKKKPQPTNPELWGRAKSAAKSKFDVWPSAYASAWASKWYKQHGGGWRMGKTKKKD